MRSRDLEHGLHFDGDIAGQGTRTHRGACMAAGFAEDFLDEIGSAIGDFRVLRVFRDGVDEDAELHALAHAVEIPVHRCLELCEHVDGAKPRRGFAVLERKVLADYPHIFERAVRQCDLARDGDKVSGHDVGHIAGHRGRGRGQDNAEFCKTFVDHSGHVFRARWVGSRQIARGRNSSWRSSLPRQPPTRYMTGMHSRSPRAETPSHRGYAMPAEWAPHRRTWMCWPCRAEAWASAAQMERARTATAEVAHAIARFEPVVMIARPDDAESAGQACGRAEIFVAPIDDSWARDTGPTFLSGGPAAGVAWRFNAWGGKYDGHDNDAALAPRVLQRAGAELFAA